jgi:hypothetical protein
MLDRARSIGLALAVSAALLLTVECGRREEAQGTASTSPTVPPMKPAPATPILAKKAELGQPVRWDVEWDKVIELAIPQEMVSRQVPSDVRRFCPRFYEMNEADKRAFWAYFFQALAGAEAGLKPETRVRHSDPEVAVTDKVTKRQVRSEGLLQLTYEDQQRYGCDFDWQRDKEMKADDPEKTILRPKNNLECGVKILNSQIIEHRKPLLSQSSYWSTLRPGTVSYHVFAKQMTNVPIACGAQQKKRKLVGQSTTGRNN